MYETLMEGVVAEGNCTLALQAVKRNRGAAGIGRMNELQAAAHVRVPEHLQRLSFERMMRTGDGYSLREVLTVGSVWWFPSTTSTTTF